MKHTALFNGINAALGMAQCIGLRSKHYSFDDLHIQASKAVGLTDFGPEYYQTGMRELLLSLEHDANLNPYGRLMLEKTMNGALINRLLMAQLKKRQPEIFSQPLIPPLIVTGLPRTGTTSLHRLLAADPDHRGVACWEFQNPIPRHAKDTEQDRIKRSEKMFKLRSKVTPELDAIHYIRAHSIEECIHFTSMTFESRLFWNLASVNSYMDWYNDAQRINKYLEYRDLLCVLQASQPNKRLVLKAPDHVDALDALLSAVPEALVVQTHRDPAAQLGSYLSLGMATRKLGSKSIDVEKDTESQLALTDASVNHIMAVRPALGAKIYDVQYQQLITNPTAQIQSIYQHFGLPYAEQNEQAFSQHTKAHGKNKHGAHSYALEEFGLSTEGVRERYKDYSTRFITQ